MRRAPVWVVVIGIAAGVLITPGLARAEGFWVTLAAGAAGAAAPADYSEFWFDSPHSPAIAVTQLSGSPNVQATTGGGTTFFGGDGTPVLLPTTDGYATLTNPGVANGSGGLPRFAGGTQASGSPQTAVPAGEANQLSANFTEPASDGSRVLTVGVTDKDGNPLGEGQIGVPEGGWWVIGLGPDGTGMNPDLPPDPIGSGDGDGGEGTPVPVPVPPTPVPTPDTVATPEPGTAVLIGLGGLTAAGWRRFTRK